MVPSAGGCDEFIRLFMFRRTVDKAKLAELEGRLTGQREEGERIKLHIVPMHDAWKHTPDAKALCAMKLYEVLRAEDKLPGVALQADDKLSLNISDRQSSKDRRKKERLDSPTGGGAKAKGSASTPVPLQ